MPRYLKGPSAGYDLDHERRYWWDNGVMYHLGTAGSFIMVCMTCGAECFRHRISDRETCFHGHGKMVPLTNENIDAVKDVWAANGDRLTTVAERKAERLEREKAGSIFVQKWGDQTEADFPLGYIDQDQK